MPLNIPCPTTVPPQQELSVFYTSSFIFGSPLTVKNTSCFYFVTRNIQAHSSAITFIKEQTPYYYIPGGLALTTVMFFSQQHHLINTTPHSLYYYHPSNYVV